MLVCTCNFCLNLFPAFPHLTALIHLYSAELLEPLSDKAMKEGVWEGWIWRGSGGPAVLQ